MICNWSGALLMEATVIFLTVFFATPSISAIHLHNLSFKWPFFGKLQLRILSNLEFLNTVLINK